MAIDQAALDEVALSREEYEEIVRRLDREPNPVELGLFGALWSEHCGYKNSKPLLRLFPTTGPRVLTEAGAENAGAVDIGDGRVIVMKIESHNHPSAVEPYQGAATGVGGIVRDIFAMGARPIAILDSLRFGELHDAHNRYLFEGVVAGIGGYGNCLGIPTVGGEVVFDDAYAANPLVNAMCVGLARTGTLASAVARGTGNPLILVGADTGRDGIHGASGLASRTDPTERFEEMRPAVQVGNPFLEKLLMEACLDLSENHPGWFVGIQDLGAAGLTSSSIETAAKGGVGIVIDVDAVPRREEGMTAYEVMLSESQERMLIVAHAEHEQDIIDLFTRWELRSNVIGEVTDDGLVRVLEKGDEVAAVSVGELTNPPLYRREGRPPARLAELQAYDFSVLPDLDAMSKVMLGQMAGAGDATTGAEAALLLLLARLNITSKRPVYRQYDHQVQTNTVVRPGSDAAVLRIKGTRRAIALSTDGNGRYCYLDPYAGGAIAVAEAARNVVCGGGKPIACTDCLNFGSPENLEVYWQMENAIRGMAEACERLGTPVVSGNVSLFNESGGAPIHPTPVVGMLGLLEDVEHARSSAFVAAGDEVYLLGPWSRVVDPSGGLAGSEYLEAIHGFAAGRPYIDIETEAAVQAACLAGIEAGVVRSAHDCSDGGLAVALAECAIQSGLGLDASQLSLPGRSDAGLFGEVQSRIVVTVAPGDGGQLREIAGARGAELTMLGNVEDDGRFRLGGGIGVAVSELNAAYESGILALLA
ncbi:MAG: phosphoribosylformylglycinamidine synthase subunit PurL [Dehalococcoidia bacterium]|nr:phosphoribosylformylglycinamidine synthase subunit PurL [Dehalococcoidia bacterium]